MDDRADRKNRQQKEETLHLTFLASPCYDVTNVPLTHRLQQQSTASMRDVALLFGLVAAFGGIFVYTFAGVVVWAWLSLMLPQSMVYGFLANAPVNFALAALTMAVWPLSTEKRRWPSDPVPLLMFIFVVWMALNSTQAPYPALSEAKLWNTMKSYPLIFIFLLMGQRKARIQALVWVLVISLGFFGMKGGLFTIINGGAYKVVGPAGIYADNNQLALALVMVIPLIQYLYSTTQQKWMRISLAIGVVLQSIAVIGSYSRGALVAIASTMGFYWWRSKNKFWSLVLCLFLAGGGLALMPPQFFERMQTIRSTDEDSSFQGRVRSWEVCFRYAVDHFPLGAGFNGTTHPAIYRSYFPGETPFVAHSIYFQVLGDHGFPGLILYLLTIWASWRNLRSVIKRHGRDPSLAWAVALARSLEIGLVGFCVGGAALSVPYWDGFLLVQALSSVLRATVDRARDDVAPVSGAKA